jgi:hypothetical protein
MGVFFICSVFDKIFACFFFRNRRRPPLIKTDVNSLDRGSLMGLCSNSDKPSSLQKIKCVEP